MSIYTPITEADFLIDCMKLSIEDGLELENTKPFTAEERTLLGIAS
jgi:hypothetical protein